MAERPSLATVVWADELLRMQQIISPSFNFGFGIAAAAEGGRAEDGDDLSDEDDNVSYLDDDIYPNLRLCSQPRLVVTY
ncbi:unnamed protein product [Gongylonema pulchrum]|uniref:Uncharacterized protein n=1 Tax=Gongylonema pulchrum TaxID=637853 RepID=A0A183DVN1_9BILA|nr:unnamed protein product [Gongylonema pulchrum]